MCIGSSSTPAPPPPPPPPPELPKQIDESVRRARNDEKRRAALATGRNATILTPLGGLSAARTAQKTLLGQ